MHKALVFAPLIFALGFSPALAAPTVIAELGTAPLLGNSASTAQMRARVAENEAIVATAAQKIGLTSAEYAQFHAAIDSSRVAWVTVPRHLDAMTWQSGGKVYALHDVIIPAGTNGWEVDVPSHGKILALYMPAKCGNLSLVRKEAPMVAHRPTPTRVAALKVAPQPAAAPAAVVPPPPVEVAAAAVAPPDDTPAPPPPAAVAAFPPVHHVSPLLFLAPLLFGVAALSGGSGSGPVAAPPAGCP